MRWLARAVYDRVIPPRLQIEPSILSATRGGNGLEIGGPSRVFSRRGIARVYAHAARIDNVNFATETAWEGQLRDGGDFVFDASRRAGAQWVREAGQLQNISECTYDFVLSSHCLEHLANPLAALHEWRRITRPSGHLLVIVPDPTRSFDHRRPITTLAHLQSDVARDTPESDTTHFAEVLSLHDLGRDPGVGSVEELHARVTNNLHHRCVHHHVFDLKLLHAALGETGWHVLATETARPVHLVAWARKEAA
jgi:SAM-dependent methyltransferase